MAKLIAKPSNKLNILTRKIKTAYFAKIKEEKVKDSDKKKISFEKLTESKLCDEVYIIAETEHLQGGEVVFIVKQGKEKVLEEVKEAIILQQDGYNTREVKANVGDFAKDDKISNKDDFKDWAIAKVELIPESKETKDKYIKALKEHEDKTSLYLVVRAHETINSFTNVFYDEVIKDLPPNTWYNGDGNWFKFENGGGITITSKILKEIFPKSKKERRKEVTKAINKYKCEFDINNIDRMAHFLGQIGTETAQLNKLKEDYNYSAKTIYKIFLRPVLYKHPTKSKKHTFKYHDLIEGYDTTLECKYTNPKTDDEKAYGHKRDVTNPIEVEKKKGKASWTYSEFSKLYTIKSEYIKSKSLFDYVYGCRMDNGKKSTKDGSDYFGVGFIHLTGKNKYKALNDKWKTLYPKDKKDFMGDNISLLKTDVDVAMKASMIIWKHVQKNTNYKADKGNNNEAITAVTKDVNGGTNGLDDRKKYTKKAYKVLNKEKNEIK